MESDIGTGGWAGGRGGKGEVGGGKGGEYFIWGGLIKAIYLIGN